MPALAQLKIPGRKELEKKAGKAVEQATKGDAGQSKAGNGEAPSGNSQVAIPPEETSSVAKGQINLFWKHIEKMRNHTDENNKQVVYSSGIQNAQMALKNTKTKDSNYNTTAMEKALQECQQVYNSLAGGKENLRQQRNETAAAATELFSTPYIYAKAAMNVGGEDVNNEAAILQALQASNDLLLEYTRRVDEFIASKPEPAMYMSKQPTVADRAKAAEGFVKSAADVYQNYRTKASVAAYQNLVICKTYLENARRVYTNEPVLDENLQKINEALTKYQSPEAFMKKMADNQKEYVKNLRMGKPMMSDATIEKVAKADYERMKMSKQAYAVTKVHIVSNWRLEKNVLDIPLHKEVYVNLAIKLADGNCGIAVGWVRQDYEGGGTYGAPRLILPSPVQELPCENLQ